MPPHHFSPGSRNLLTRHDLGRFAGDTLFDRIGRTLCTAEVLPRKELYEAWEVARRTRRLFRGGRIVDVAGGHGLLALLMLLLDDTSPTAVVVDPVVPASARQVREALEHEWPRLAGRVEYTQREIATVALTSADVVVSCHACGALTDEVLRVAMQSHARVAVLPCCHDADTCDAGALLGWMDVSLAVDVVRAERLRATGARVWTQQIPADITPKNRLLLADFTPRCP